MFPRRWTSLPLLPHAAARLLSQEARSGGIQGLNLTYSPARPPAIPLAVRSPYASIWSTTANGSVLNSKDVMFWNGQEVGWEGVITVDGVSYEYLGAGFDSLASFLKRNLTSAVPSHVAYDSSSSVFTFAAGMVEVKATFSSPMAPHDLCRTSAPLSYLDVTFTSLDGRPHDVQFYSDVSSRMLAPEGAAVKSLLTDTNRTLGIANMSNFASDTVLTWHLELHQPLLFGEINDFPRWGSLVYSTSRRQASNLTFQNGLSTEVRHKYIDHHRLANVDGLDERGRGRDDPVYAFAHDFGRSNEGSVLYTIGTVQNPIVQILASPGLTPLTSWWTQCYGSMGEMINAHYNEYSDSQINATAWDLKLRSDVRSYFSRNPTTSADLRFAADSTNGTDQFGTTYTFDSGNAYGWLHENSTGLAVPGVEESDSYYAIVALSARQVMGAYVLTTRVPSGETPDPDASEPMMFQKEISSNGNVNTVDVLYPAMPFFLYANPRLLKYAMEPLFLYQEQKFYPNQYSIHDIGAHFPNATGHVGGDDEPMEVEECGNMLIMTYAVFKFLNDTAVGTSYVRQHLPILQQWAEFLKKDSLIPTRQLSTDDFAGRLTNQTNLAVKGILGMKAMLLISDAIPANGGSAPDWGSIVGDYFSKWEAMAVDPSARHTMLAYQYRASWGLLYNIYPDKLLGLNVVPQRIYDMQSKWYAEVSQVFGVPLDSRNSQTKTDWEMWTAACCQPSTRRLFINSIAYWLNHTVVPTPFSDLFSTLGYGDKPEGIGAGFMARPVVGGHFSLLALVKAEELGIGK